MQTLPFPVLAATALGILAAAAGLSVAVVASLRGGRAAAAARRLAPLTVTPAIVAFLLSSLALGGRIPAAVPPAGVVLVAGGLVPVVRSLWRTPPEDADAVSDSGDDRYRSPSGAD
ncbi:hypothetical protein [Haloglomus litoreum]|uniref:hypothetical protein n=1 Tax=Haloglomus litoreum TaxID=3034026 RepID=UPI0023E8E83E|nr:hypothetical protein [Haloglomus sp. DT116]